MKWFFHFGVFVTIYFYKSNDPQWLRLIFVLMICINYCCLQVFIHGVWSSNAQGGKSNLSHSIWILILNEIVKFVLGRNPKNIFFLLGFCYPDDNLTDIKSYYTRINLYILCSHHKLSTCSGQVLHALN